MFVMVPLAQRDSLWRTRPLEQRHDLWILAGDIGKGHELGG